MRVATAYSRVHLRERRESVHGGSGRDILSRTVPQMHPRVRHHDTLNECLLEGKRTTIRTLRLAARSRERGLAGTVRAMEGAAGASRDGFTAFPAEPLSRERAVERVFSEVLRVPPTVTR
jgi:hypothetical protein